MKACKIKILTGYLCPYNSVEVNTKEQVKLFRLKTMAAKSKAGKIGFE